LIRNASARCNDLIAALEPLKSSSVSMQRPVPRNKSVKFSPGTSEDGSDDDSARHAIKPRRSARSLKPGHLSIQPGLSNAHLILRRYTALDEFGAVSDLSDDEQELLNSPKVAPAQPIDRYVTVSSILQAVRPHHCHPLFCCIACNSLQACAELRSIMLSTATRAHSAAFANVVTQVQRPCKGPDHRSKTCSAKDKLFTTCRDALQALVSPTDAQLALCSSGAYGEKEGEGPHKGMLPAQIELEKLSKRWNVPTGLHTATASEYKAYQSCHCSIQALL